MYLFHYAHAFLLIYLEFSLYHINSKYVEDHSLFVCSNLFVIQARGRASQVVASSSSSEEEEQLDNVPDHSLGLSFEEKYQLFVRKEWVAASYYVRFRSSATRRGVRGLLDEQHGDKVHAALNRQGWCRLIRYQPEELEISNDLMARLVANTRSLEDDWTLVTALEGRPLRISIEDVSTALQIPNPQGSRVCFYARNIAQFEGLYHWPTDVRVRDWPRNPAAAWELIKAPGSASGNLVKDLMFPFSALDKIIRRTIYPKKGENTRVTTIILCILVCMKLNVQFNLPSLVLLALRHISKLSASAKKEIGWAALAIRVAHLKYGDGFVAELRTKYATTQRLPYNIKWSSYRGAGHPDDGAWLEKRWSALDDQFPDIPSVEEPPVEPSAAADRQAEIRRRRSGKGLAPSAPSAACGAEEDDEDDSDPALAAAMHASRAEYFEQQQQRGRGAGESSRSQPPFGLPPHPLLQPFRETDYPRMQRLQEQAARDVAFYEQRPEIVGFDYQAYPTQGPFDPAVRDEFLVRGVHHLRYQDASYRQAYYHQIEDYRAQYGRPSSAAVPPRHPEPEEPRHAHPVVHHYTRRTASQANTAGSSRVGAPDAAAGTPSPTSRLRRGPPHP